MARLGEGVSCCHQLERSLRLRRRFHHPHPERKSGFHGHLSAAWIGGFLFITEQLAAHPGEVYWQRLSDKNFLPGSRSVSAGNCLRCAMPMGRSNPSAGLKFPHIPVDSSSHPRHWQPHARARHRHSGPLASICSSFDKGLHLSRYSIFTLPVVGSRRNGRRCSWVRAQRSYCGIFIHSPPLRADWWAMMPARVMLSASPMCTMGLRSSRIDSSPACERGKRGRRCAPAAPPPPEKTHQLRKGVRTAVSGSPLRHGCEGLAGFRFSAFQHFAITAR
jgi:hypothetical protein